MSAGQLSFKDAAIAFAVALSVVLLMGLLELPDVATFSLKKSDQQVPPKRCTTELYLHRNELYVKSNCLQYYELYINGRPVQPCPACAEVGRLMVQLNETIVVLEIREPRNATLYAVKASGGYYEFVDKQTGKTYRGYIMLHWAGSAT